MWHLDKLKPEILDNFVDLILPLMKTRVNELSIESIRKYLSDERLEGILRNTPEILEKMVDDLKINLFPGNEYDSYIVACKKRKRTKKQEELKNKYSEVIGVFDYKNFISSKVDHSYKIASWIGVNTCVYCNRQYTLTVTTEKEKITRPEFDHFFPQSIYPFFALSIYNLIPSCSICNEKSKGLICFKSNLNPYILEDRNFFRFSYSLKAIDDLHVVLKPADDNSENKIDPDIQELLDVFHIQDLYDGHSTLELKDIYDFAYKYSPTYLENLLKITKNKLHITVEDAYRMLFGTEYKIKDYHNRPFSKFKKDLLKEFGVIKDDD